MSTRSKKKLHLQSFSQNESAIAAVETTIPRAANTRMKCVTNVKRKATWQKYVKERRKHKSKEDMGAGRMVNKERILSKKAPIKMMSMPCIICPAIERNRSKWIWNFVDGKTRWKSTLQTTKAAPSTYTGERIPVLGAVMVPVEYEGKKKNLNALIVAGNGPNLLGRDWLEQIRLDWSTIFHMHMASEINPPSALQSVLAKYPDVFMEGLGTQKGVKAKIYVDQGAQPKYIKARSVPYALKTNVELEL